MRVFVAASWTDRGIAKLISEKLESRGFTITGQWWTHEGMGNENAKLYSIIDIASVRSADVFVMYNVNEHGNRQGKLVELGIAIDRDIPRLVFGDELLNIYREQTIYRNIHDVDEIVKVILEMFGK